ncbi:MAG: 3-phosphoserine/phosphohydroxythreonine transaminase [Verrucomicrobiota bacterium]
MSKVYNFNAGPATLPESVLEKARDEFVDFRGTGMGLIEHSHRGDAFKEVLAATEADAREIMNLNDEYAVLFLQGGASQQFAMTAMNLALAGKPMLYADTGSWTSKAIKEAKLFGDVKTVYSGKDSNYTTIGDPNDWDWSGDASYAYMCSNNTIYGTQYHTLPDTGNTPLIADMSSDILSRVLDFNKFGVIFAGAQKNLGPAGVTFVVIRKDLAERAGADVPTMLNYTTHIEKDSCFNTPPVFAIYMVGLVLQWIKQQGGLKAVQRINETKSDTLYNVIDSSDFYQGTAAPADRSRMNVTFRLANTDLESQFVSEATAAGLVGLKGHRSVGGIRASIYNAMPLAGVSALIDFMNEFERKNG